MITIDDREAREAEEHHQVNILEALGIPSRIERLEAADYAFLTRSSAPLGIERCEIGNLIQKLSSGELEEQLVRCQEAYSHVILLIEGVYSKVGEEGLLSLYKEGERGFFRTRVFPNTRYNFIKALEVRLLELGIEILSTPGFSCSLVTIATIYQQRVKLEEEHTLFKKSKVLKIPTKYTTNPAVPKLMSLCPRLPEVVAIQLIGKFNSIWNILQTPDTDLLTIEGFGKTLLKRLKEGVGKE